MKKTAKGPGTGQMSKYASQTGTRPRTAIAALAVLMFAVSGPLQAAQQEVHVGRAKVVVHNVRAQLGEAAPKSISVDERLRFEERIFTTADSRSVVEFRDGSVLQIGPNAIVILDRFVFNPFESKSEKVITAVTGAFRYISGMKTKTSALEIRTESATIGIRGSLAEFAVYPNLPTVIAMAHGTATVRNARSSVQVGPGQATAVRSRDADVPPPDRIPAAVTVQVLQHIGSQVGAPPPPTVLTPAAPTEAQADAEANQLSTAAQLALQGGAPPALPAVLPPPPPGAAPPAGLNLLTRAVQVGLLDTAPGGALTPAQRSFVADANNAIPNAAQQIQAAVAAGQQQTRANGNRSAGNVVKAAVQLAPQDATITTLVTTSAQADTEAALAIAEAALSGAPAFAVQIAGAAATGAPAEAGLIAGGIARIRPELAAAISVVVTNVNKDAAGAIVAAIAQNVPAGQAAEALAAVANVVPEASTALIAAVAQVSPEAAAQALSQISTAAGGEQNTPAAPPPPPPPPVLFSPPPS
jgi:hypothetical protein